MPGKVAILDIETSSLEADSGILVGAGLLPESGPAEYLPVGKTAEEKKVLTRLLTRLEEFEVIVTWNGRSFDIPFLTARLLIHRLDPRTIVSKRQIDLNEIVKGRLRLTFTYLEHVCDFLGIEKKKGPMGLDVPHLYLRASEGDRRSLAIIREHCLDDLEATRKVYQRLKPLLESYL